MQCKTETEDVKVYEIITKIQNGDKEVFDQFFKENTALIKIVVHKFLNIHNDYDELFQVASIGFIQCVRKFDTKFGYKFSTYAVPTMEGMIKRFLRDYSSRNGTIKWSRTVISYSKWAMKQADIHNVSAHEFIRNDKNVDDEFKLSAYLYIAGPMSMDEEFQFRPASDPITLHEMYASEDVDIDYNVMLDEIKNFLKKREWEIFVSRFIDEKSQTEVAKMHNISQVQISRIEKKIKEKLQDFYR